MTIALCVIDKKTKKLWYAGAGNPMYYIQNGVFQELKGNSKHIGGRDDEDDIRTFDLYEVDLSEPTYLYLCSDGYRDQFGGDKGRKFSSKQ
jgi:hypothetical protein